MEILKQPYRNSPLPQLEDYDMRKTARELEMIYKK